MVRSDFQTTAIVFTYRRAVGFVDRSHRPAGDTRQPFENDFRRMKPAGADFKVLQPAVVVEDEKIRECATRVNPDSHGSRARYLDSLDLLQRKPFAP